jgi:hypothetical protein
MADKKITELTELTATDPADILPIVDVSDTTDASSGTTKHVTIANINQIYITSHDETEGATAATMYGNVHKITGAYTVTLPAAVVGMSGIFRATTAAEFSLDCDGSDHFEAFDGTVGGAGKKLTSSGAKNEWLSVYCEVANTWIVIGQNGVFTLET